MLPGLALLIAGVLALSSAASPVDATEAAIQGEASLEVVLERAGAYALRYGESFRNLSAEEVYRQVVAGGGTATPVSYPAGTGYSEKEASEVSFGQLGSAESSMGRVRNMRSHVVFVRLPGAIPWYTFRDVYLVDGVKVQDRTGRLERLFANPSPSALEQARAILEESTRYNFGAVHRNVNAPTVALFFLLPENQARLVFERKGSKTIAGFRTVEVAFEERTRPTLVKDLWGRDVPASGSYWIDPSRGTVLRTRIEYHVAEVDNSLRDADSSLPRGTRVIADVLTKYRREPGLDIFVPDTMTDWYRIPGGGHIDSLARYLEYRRFQVTSDWEVADPKRPPESEGAPRP